jgi:hypothetical protein
MLKCHTNKSMVLSINNYIYNRNLPSGAVALFCMPACAAIVGRRSVR